MSACNKLLNILQNGDCDDNIEWRIPINVKVELYAASATFWVMGTDIGYIDICFA